MAQTVAIGAFNPYIVTPGWLVRYGFYGQIGVVNIQLVPIGEGAAFTFGSTRWQVDNQRLSVSSSDRNVDCGGLVSRVLQLLPHTPVGAVGHNFHFVTTKEDWAVRPTPRLGSRSLFDLEDAEQERWVGAFRRDGVRIEATLACEVDAVAVLFNHHRTMNLERMFEAKTAEEQIQPAIAAAQLFQADFAVSRSLLRSLFEMEMPDE